MNDIAMGTDTPSPEVVLPGLGPPVIETVVVGDQTFLIQKPSQSDKRLDTAATDSALSEYVPYWADLWPGSRMLAKVIQQESWSPGTEALELGCGLGLPGIVALSRGLRVTFSDQDLCALSYAAANARLNGFDDVATLQLDWRRPPAGRQFPVIFGADLIYEASHAEWLVSCIKQLLAPEGVAWLTDLERIPVQGLRAALETAGLQYTTRVIRAGEPAGRRYKGTLYQVRRARSASEGG